MSHEMTVDSWDEPTRNTWRGSTRRMHQVECTCGWRSRPKVQKWAVETDWDHHNEASEAVAR